MKSWNLLKIAVVLIFVGLLIGLAYSAFYQWAHYLIFDENGQKLETQPLDCKVTQEIQNYS